MKITTKEYKQTIESLAAKIGENPNKYIKKKIMNKLDIRILIGVIVYAVLIGVAWGISRNNIDNNKISIKVNQNDIVQLENKAIKSEVDIKGLSVRMEYMIALQKEMNERLKDLKK